MLLKISAPTLFILLVLLLGSCAREVELLDDASDILPDDSLASELIPDLATVIQFDSTAGYLQTFVDSKSKEEDAIAEAVHTNLERFYGQGIFKPAWLNGLTLTAHAITLIRDVCNADAASLLPVSYHPDLLYEALDNAAGAPTHETLAALDLQLSRTFMRYADDHLGGRLDPEMLPYDIYLDRPDFPLDSVMKATLNRPVPSSFSQAMQPEHPHYERLIQALERYRTIVDSGGWPAVASEEVLKFGTTHPSVPDLRLRLHKSGDLVKHASLTDTSYDAMVAAAVAGFQARHGLRVDSTVGPATLGALNVTARDRLYQIERNIERWRWLPQNLSDRYVLVNIPAFEVFAYDEGKEALNMRVIVGSEYNEQYTPVFSDRMDYVVFRPFWNVPHSIASEEIAPKALTDSTFISRNNYEILAGNQIVTPDEEALQKLINGEYRIRQKAGPRNALGLVKFIFPNRHAIYLHDTPADYLFERNERDLSHGCIRLEDPPRFASFVLGRQGWTPDQIHEAIYEGERQKVLLEEPIPVYLMYLTAFVDDQGVVSFYDDVYGHDEILDDLLLRRKQRIQSSIRETQVICHALQKYSELS